MPRKSDKQQLILQYVKDFLAENGYTPSVREIGAAVGLQSTASVHYHLTQLSRAGLIGLDAKKKRAISITPEQRGIPILGVVTAGMPILAVENIEGFIPWEGDTDCFALRIRGDSMIGAGIMDGDYVVVRQQPTADSGQIVIALLGDEATCKRLLLEAGHVWLKPENPQYPLIDGTEASIIGLVKAVIRTY